MNMKYISCAAFFHYLTRFGILYCCIRGRVTKPYLCRRPHKNVSWSEFSVTITLLLRILYCTCNVYKYWHNI